MIITVSIMYYWYVKERIYAVMRKYCIFRISCTIFLAICLTVSVDRAEAVDQTENNPDKSATESDDPERSQLIESAFNVLYQKNTEDLPVIPDQLESLLKQLDEYEKTYPEDIRSVLQKFQR